jgi:peroxiredoxin
VAIVAQHREAVRRYIEETGLPYDILIDETREVARAYGVWHRIGVDAWNIARPALFVVDPAGKVAYSFIGRSQWAFAPRDAVVAELKRLARPGV